MEEKFKYFAFISYSSQDIKWGIRIQRKLESYRIPATLCSKYGWKKKPMRPIFFAPTDIQPGGLTVELQDRLRKSKHLIVVCSPYSAQSEWVAKEIEFFHHLGRTDRIHLFIVNGLPHSGCVETECFNPIIGKLDIPEILGANVHEKVFRWSWLNKERAYVQLITKLLGIEFDSIWQRHRRLLQQKIAFWLVGVIGLVVALIVTWRYNAPVDVVLGFIETTPQNRNLPPLKNGIITIRLGDETKVDTIRNISEEIVFPHVPYYYLGKKVHFVFSCIDYVGLDTVLVLERHCRIKIKRDANVYGKGVFRIWNPHTETVVKNCKVSVDGISCVSDEGGYVNFTIPLERQRLQYDVDASIPLVDHVIYMPCGDNDVICVR